MYRSLNRENSHQYKIHEYKGSGGKIYRVASEIFREVTLFVVEVEERGKTRPTGGLFQSVDL